MLRSSVGIITKLVDETLHMQCGRNLLGPDGTQAGEIISVDAVRLERVVPNSDPEQWEVAVAAEGFTQTDILDDGVYANALVAALLSADPDSDPPAGYGYMFIAECTIQLSAALGGGTIRKVFRRPYRVAPGAVTAPAPS